MESRNVFLAVLVLFVAAVLLTFKAGVSFADTDNVTVNVTVQSLTEITVTPINVTWSLLTPGIVGGQRNITVQNTGSTNATNLYAYVTTLINETTRPYGGSLATSYASGGVLVLRNESLGFGNFSWAGRLEWNWTEQISGTDLSTAVGGSSSTPSFRAEGFIRNTTKQVYWAVFNGTPDGSNAGCNNTGAEFTIESDEDNGTSVTRTPTDSGITIDAADRDAGFAYYAIDRAGHFLQGMCVAVDFNCTKIYIYNHDKRASAGTNFNLCNNADYILGNTPGLTPSDIEKVTADIWMPKGIPAGQMANTQLIFAVTGV